MRRALSEYQITGIRTTLPFFSWLFEEEDFVAGRFHTAYLDEVLVTRVGRPFVEAEPGAEEVAALAAAVQAALSPDRASGVGNGAPRPASRWGAQARIEGLRS